jgi:hypothetical protein
MLRTGFRASFVSTSHIPGSQNTVRRSEYMKKKKKNRNAVWMAGLLRASDGFRGKNRDGIVEY